jgi:hypothetical protein
VIAPLAWASYYHRHKLLFIFALIFLPRQRNLWVTDTVEWCRETRPAYPLPDGEGFGSFS